ncbi:MAG TPA: hypothetical protein VGX28_11065 [Frankiaceae bacterium]|jgi:tRNA A37 threonylcarbamoyladenosine synthetase subunit TsaC/SUA5/YrdC|nr:hypothetical protein [Frankiaceae bacterium]
MTLPRILAAASLAAASVVSLAAPASAAPCVDVIVPGPVIAVCPARPEGPPLLCVGDGPTVCVTVDRIQG